MRPIVLLVSVVTALAVATPADAAAPRFILVTGPGLVRPVVLGDWRANLDLYTSMLNMPRVRRPPSSRPRYDLALFWGVPARPVPARPGAASQHGTYWPAAGSRPAVIELQLAGTLVPRAASPRALRVLARHGVPIRVA
jgi:hypothetical protein